MSSQGALSAYGAPEALVSAPVSMTATAQIEDESRSPETIIGRGALPFFLAAIAGAQDVVNQQQYKCYCNMCSGNTLNLMMKFGSGDWFPDVPFLIGMISHFCASKIARTLGIDKTCALYLSTHYGNRSWSERNTHLIRCPSCCL